MRKIVLLMVVAASLTAAACNTVSGAGKDVSATGKAVARAAAATLKRVHLELGGKAPAVILDLDYWVLMPR